jgi:hypothetical protein
MTHNNCKIIIVQKKANTMAGPILVNRTGISAGYHNSINARREPASSNNIKENYFRIFH